MRRTLYITLAWLLHISTVCGQPRCVSSLNSGWMFSPGDNRTEWQAANLPHSFSIPYFLSKDFYVGYGWYRKGLTLNTDDMKRRLSIEFDGVFQVAEVYVNGSKAGEHRGGYTGFEIDITPFVHKGENEISVRVNNLWDAQLAPRGGEHVFSGGIYRNVRLVKRSKEGGICWSGIRITTPGLEESGGQHAMVTADVETVTGSGHTRIEMVITDSDGRTVAKAQGTSSPLTAAVDTPHLWSTDTPYLYIATVRLYKGRKLLDEVRETFGFRWTRWSKEEGFFLNGRHLYLRGANVHQDQAGWGDAVTDEAARRDVRMIKEAGFNMIRGSHYPHSPAFVDECDRQGILFWSEAPFWGTAGEKRDGYWTASSYPAVAEDTSAFEASAVRQLEEMIQIHRNHPSVFAWSMCNEPFFCDYRVTKDVARLLRRMVRAAHKADPTRPAAIGGAQRPLGADRIDMIGDIAGYNGDGANIADFQHPDVPSIVSEYGSTTADRPGRYIPGWGDLARDDGWKGRTWRGGHAIWCAFDHGSIFGHDMATMGIVDYFRLPKRSWYWYRKEYAGIEPPQWPAEGVPAMLLLTASKTDGIGTDGTDDTQLTVTVADADGTPISNSPDVTLSIISGPGELPTGRSITFSRNSDITILDGKAAIAMRAYQAGETTVEVTSDGLPPTRLKLRFTGKEKYTEGKSMVITSRPYVRLTASEAAKPQTFGTNNPTFSCSTAEGHSAGYATDGDNATYWQPAPSVKEPWIILDMERSVNISGIKTDSSVPPSSVTVSDDKEHWHPATLPVTGRYVRIMFSTPDVRMHEIQITGTLNTK